MANKVFLDTGGWLSLLNSTDDYHARANYAWRALAKEGYQVYFTDWVVAETGNGLARSMLKTAFAEALTRFESSRRFELIFVDQVLLNRAVELYQSRADKSYGLVDCASFLVMWDNEISEAFTMDHHFEQAGFQIHLDART